MGGIGLELSGNNLCCSVSNIFVGLVMSLENHMVQIDEEDYIKLYGYQEQYWDEDAAMEKYYDDKYNEE